MIIGDHALIPEVIRQGEVRFDYAVNKWALDITYGEEHSVITQYVASEKGARAMLRLVEDCIVQAAETLLAERSRHDDE